MVTAMLINKIQFDNLRFAPDRTQHCAVVILTTDESTLCLLGKVDLPESAARDDVALGLMHDALRQIRQMPEFRTRQDVVQIADDATQEFRQTA